MSEIPDSAPIFEEPPRREYGKWCFHERYVVNQQQRSVTCCACQAKLDPFEIVLQQSNKTRMREDTDKLIREGRETLKRLHDDERKTKARLRNARKKDADAAVAKALATKEENRERALYGLLGARASITDALKRLGYDGTLDEDGEGWKHA